MTNPIRTLDQQRHAHLPEPAWATDHHTDGWAHTATGDVRTYALAVDAADQHLTVVAVGLQRADGSTTLSVQVHGVGDALVLDVDGALALGRALLSAASKVAALEAGR